MKERYSNTRAQYLEEAIEKLLRSALPHASIFRGVAWTDDDGKEYENDVVAMLGNTIFLFEAKSGRISDSYGAAAMPALIRNFRELFVEPGEQAWRLEETISIESVNTHAFTIAPIESP